MSIIGRLPPEILGYIFEIGDDLGWEEGWEGCRFDDFHPTIPISTVCRQWRRIALSTPRAWSSFYVDLSIRYSRFAWPISLDALQLLVERSGSIPVRIRVNRYCPELDYHPFGGNPEFGDRYEAFERVKALSALAPRWGAFHFRFNRSDDPFLPFLLHQETPQLQELKIVRTANFDSDQELPSYIPEALFPYAPYLTSIQVRGIVFPSRLNPKPVRPILDSAGANLTSSTKETEDLFEPVESVYPTLL